ncbi:MAG: bifunctional 4-hydroxy-2-oxoglutarate aldolase/2-dehydro-3-deoxy-phosphogluconate aldolase [Kiritimatiellae bacterium]|nr:bifunctional 4-hydroxy-2-oxoglutarate aldolase/2-dehydro-3-deoxy-phosphogluconate aldolase [Kiritimatiellia bacterium]
MREEVLKAIKETKVIAIIRGMDVDVCVNLAKAYYEGGIRLVEVTFDQTGDPKKTIDAIKAIRNALGEKMFVGAGTVLTSEQLKMLIDAGGEFMVTPSTNVNLIRECRAAGLVALPGALTPTEIVTAWEAGADYVKVFPVRALGVSYVKDVLAPLKHIPLLAVGGVNPENIASYMEAGCKGAGASGSLVNKDWIKEGSWGKITAVARALIENAAG